MPRLNIYVDSHCTIRDEARRLATVLSGLATGLTVQVVELDQPGVKRPPGAFATPTDLLDGRVIALGNRTLERVRQALREAGVPFADSAV